MKKEKPERIILGEDLRPNYRLKNDPVRITEVEIQLNPSPETLKRRAEEERNTLIKRAKIINERPEFFNNLQKVDIDIINDDFYPWNLFDWPTKMEQMDLARSIDTVGLINPIYVTLDKTGRYNVIVGRCRLLAFCDLWKATSLDKYRFIPCYVIPYEDVDELFIRSIMIESNICFRKISKGNMIKALLENHTLMKLGKQFRNESNVGIELSKLFQISESSVFNYLKVRSLCNPAQTLLYDDEISIQAATYLTKVSKEKQEKILEAFGKEGVKAIFRLKLLTKDENITIEQLQKEINRVKSLVPEKTRITIEVSKKLLSPLMQHLLDFKRTNAAEQAGRMQGKFKNVFTVRFNDKDLGYYKGMIDEIVLKKLLSKNISDMAKIK
ncbi:MAG: ParB N-terminal domain-containing protein [Oscillospiraceae bacterium]|nr:ParB N-terminal domain-containing protein [Oscillospiraceae bacterium]